jgi:hypothetical protein
LRPERNANSILADDSADPSVVKQFEQQDMRIVAV